MSVFRIYVEKKDAYAVEASKIFSDLSTALQFSSLQGVRIINRYDVEGISQEVFESARGTIFSEPQVDVTYSDIPAVSGDHRIFASEYLPGQFDQRADSCAQCIQLMTQSDRPLVRTARIYILSGKLTDQEFDRIKDYLINPVESREASLAAADTLDVRYTIPTTVETLTGFIQKTEEELGEFVKAYGLAMDQDDLLFCRDYFKNTEKRDPTITEIRMIDTYWSDHCRHTTFLTEIDQVHIEPDYVKKSYEQYLECREVLYAGKDKPLTLMDLAVIGAKRLKKAGLLKDLDESEEINACSVKLKVDVDGKTEDWLLMFKNETHNHPTEIEPFGGAATCLGGAIRDPLSGRSYVYQAMRVTGAADPLLPVSKTRKGKLPQRKIVNTAANGYSAYGNQIGLATGHVSEVYDPGYVAKRLEIGAVIGAAPAQNVVRERPCSSDAILLLGGKTGRDGCGGATGSSKSHTLESLESCGAEVQKGNPPEERKLQRLFRNPDVTRLIKRCNDFGAGGISVAIGELADGLIIDLDKVLKKYDGLDGTELAISESQERMAVVVRKEDVDKFIEYAHKENLDATEVAVVTQEPRLRMNWNGNTIVDLSREFLNSNGAKKKTNVFVASPQKITFPVPEGNDQEFFETILTDLNVCSQKGLVERFDSTIGASSVLMPYGGKYQTTPTQAMAAKLPVLHGDTTTCSLMSWGFNPVVSKQSPYHGAVYAVVESVAKVIAAGGSKDKCWLTFQEYFERTNNDPSRWGKPFSALLGALQAQLELKIAAIGGKDSMSGTFEDIDVPPTLASFAVSTSSTHTVISPEFKKAGSRVCMLAPRDDENSLPDYESVLSVLETVTAAIEAGEVLSAWAVSYGGVAEGIAKMSMGNRIGFAFTKKVSGKLLASPCPGAFLLEMKDNSSELGLVIGETIGQYEIRRDGSTVSMSRLEEKYEAKLEPIYPVNTKAAAGTAKAFSYTAAKRPAPSVKVAKPRVVIPVFPGTNCEYDTARRFERAGAIADIFVINNLTSQGIEDSVQEIRKAIRNSQIIMLPGGFSGGDEPDGSAKFITAFFRNPAIRQEVTELLENRDGLMLGICNGFQALVKLGLVPFGKIIETDADCPTLTFNTIGRHQSMLVQTRIASNLSPWLAYSQVGDLHTVPISHGEGRFIANDSLLQTMEQNGQIATQYVDLSGVPSMDIRFNPNTSVQAIEGITSPDGRVFGKMAHSERIGDRVYLNVPGEKDQKIFEAGVDYFTK